jgi:glyoxylase-like metal-dependent hydrolase (beta-lactamase superfamily II)
VHRLGNARFNWYLVEEGGRLTAVDAGLPGFKKTLSDDLGILGVRPEEIEAVILTHADADHMGLASTFRERGARVLIHPEGEPKLRRPGPKSGDASPVAVIPQMWRPLLWRLFGEMMLAGAARPPTVDDAETFAAGDVLDVPGNPRVIATPGHAPGHCAFQFERQGALFVGDEFCTWNVLTGSRGPQLMPHGMNESDQQCLESLDVLEPLEAEVVLFGHGEPWRDGVAAAVRQARAAWRG